jgi:hypothetical protein
MSVTSTRHNDRLAWTYTAKNMPYRVIRRQRLDVCLCVFLSHEARHPRCIYTDNKLCAVGEPEAQDRAYVHLPHCRPLSALDVHDIDTPRRVASNARYNHRKPFVLLRSSRPGWIEWTDSQWSAMLPNSS